MAASALVIPMASTGTAPGADPDSFAALELPT